MPDKDPQTSTNPQVSNQPTPTAPPVSLPADTGAATCPNGPAWLFCVRCGAPSVGRANSFTRRGARVCVGCGE